MPTRGRPEYARLAVECFHAQAYQNRELVILDDTDDPSFPDGVIHPAIRYFREPQRTIPEKRNRVNGLATGDLICHFDSDDWSDPQRMEQQVALLLESGKAVTGYHTLLFHDDTTGRAYEYRSDGIYALGTSLCYFKWWWELNRFNERKPIGSDNWFVRAAQQARQIHSVHGERMMVARIHPDSTNKNRRLGQSRGMGFYEVSRDRLPVEFPAGILA